MFRPNWPLELATPVGQCRDLELSMIFADSQPEAATITGRTYSTTSRRVARSIYGPPVARRPSGETRTLRTWAFARSSSLPVRSASGRKNIVGEKKDPVSHPVVHPAQ